MDQGQLAQTGAALALRQAGTGQEANQLRDPGNHDWLPTSSFTEWVPVQENWPNGSGMYRLTGKGQWKNSANSHNNPC